MWEWFDHVASTWDLKNLFMWVAGPGFAVWYAMHTTRVVMPRRDRQFLAEIASLRKAQETIVQKFTEELRFQREENQQLMAEMRKHHREDLATFWTELKAENRVRHDDTLRLIQVITELKAARVKAL